MSLNADSLDELVAKVTRAADDFKKNGHDSNRIAALTATQKLARAFEKPQDAAYNVAYSPTHSLCTRIGIDLGIFETLVEKNGPTTLEELAAPKKADKLLTERVLRILAGIGYVTEYDVRVYTPTIMTKQLTSRLTVAMILFIFDVGMPTLAKIPEFLRQTNFQNPSGTTNGPFQFTENINESIWEWLFKRPAYFDNCNTFMEGDRGSRPSWLEWFPVQEQIIDGFQDEGGKDEVLLVDVAGGRGHDLQDFVSRFPDAPGRFVLEDLSHVVEGATTTDPRIERLGIDLFKPQQYPNLTPQNAGAKTYYMKFILHDWSDEESKQILHQLHAAMKKGYSKLIIEEFILSDKNCPLLPAMWDWEMMIFCNSMERSASHWSGLLESARFSVVKVWFAPGDAQGIVEAVPV